MALGEVIGAPDVRSDHDNPYWVDPEAVAQVTTRVQVRYVRGSGLPLWVDAEAESVAASLSVARARGGSVFRITSEQWRALVAEVGGWSEALALHEEIATLASPSRADLAHRNAVRSSSARWIWR